MEGASIDPFEPHRQLVPHNIKYFLLGGLQFSIIVDKGSNCFARVEKLILGKHLQYQVLDDLISVGSLCALLLHLEKHLRVVSGLLDQATDSRS